MVMLQGEPVFPLTVSLSPYILVALGQEKGRQ